SCRRSGIEEPADLLLATSQERRRSDRHRARSSGRGLALAPAPGSGRRAGDAPLQAGRSGAGDPAHTQRVQAVASRAHRWSVGVPGDSRGSPLTYLDTSALVKRFVSEAGSSEVQDLLIGGQPVACATIAYAELHSGLARRHREGALSQLEYRLVCRRFETDWM